MNIVGFTTDNSISTGSIAQKDFKQNGRIGVEFHIFNGRIGLSIAGFCTNHIFYLKPIKNQIITNRIFYKKFIQKFNNKERIDEILNDFKNCM